MTHKRVSLAIAGILALTLAQTTASTAADLTETQGYLGLSFPLNGALSSTGPELVVGAVRSTTTAAGDVQGLRAALHVGVMNGIHPSSLRLSLFKGQTNLVGEVGAGFAFGQGLFPTWGIAGSHLQIGGAFGQNAPSEFTFGFTTLQDFVTPAAEETTTHDSCLADAPCHPL